MDNILTIQQRPLIVLFVIALSLLLPVLISVPIGHMLLVNLQNGESIFITNYLPAGVDSTSLERYIETFNTIAAKLSIFGVTVASVIASTLLLFRLKGEKEYVRIDERLGSILVVILWFIVFNLFFPEPYGDEYVHQRAIVGIYDGDWSDTNPLSMIPGYHYLVAIISELFGPALILSRFVTMLFSIGMLMFYFQAVKYWKKTDVGHTTLALTLLPILWPFSVGVYTDAPALFFVFGALWALSKRQYKLSATLVFIACVVRQSNLVWAAFLMVLASWELWQEWRSKEESSNLIWKDFILKICLPKVYVYGVAILAFLVLIFSLTKGLIWGEVPLNRAYPNINQYYVLSLFIILFWAPIWLGNFRQDLVALKQTATSKPMLVGGVFFLLTVLTIVLFQSYENFHPWNQYWYYLRNNHLILMEHNAGWRFISIFVVYWTAWVVFQLWRTQPFRMELAIVGLFSVVFLLPQALIEPRYFIVPFALFNLFLVFSSTQQKRLIIWWAILCAIIGTAVIVGHFRYIFVAW